MKRKQVGLYLSLLVLATTLIGCNLAKKEKQTADSIDKDAMIWPQPTSGRLARQGARLGEQRPARPS